MIGVQETKLDDIDCIQLPGYEIICKNRKKMSRYRSGGIAVLVNSTFSPFIKFHENKSSHVQWFTISKRLTNLESDILCGNIYIPPYGSKYAHEDPYLEIHTEFNHYCTGSNDVIMFGDCSRAGLSVSAYNNYYLILLTGVLLKSFSVFYFVTTIHFMGVAIFYCAYLLRTFSLVCLKDL